MTARTFFALSDEEKRRYDAGGSTPARGYIPRGQNTQTRRRQLYRFGREPGDLEQGGVAWTPAAALFYRENVWPGDDIVPGMRAAFEEYYRAMDRLATLLLRAFGLALGAQLGAGDGAGDGGVGGDNARDDAGQSDNECSF